jgi:hypothetical protein
MLVNNIMNIKTLFICLQQLVQNFAIHAHKFKIGEIVVR